MARGRLLQSTPLPGIDGAMPSRNSRIGDLVTDWLEFAIVRKLGGTSSEADDQIHLGAQGDAVAGARARRANGQLAVRLDFDIHEKIERGRDAIGRDAEAGEMGAKFSKQLG